MLKVIFIEVLKSNLEKDHVEIELSQNTVERSASKTRTIVV